MQPEEILQNGVSLTFLGCLVYNKEKERRIKLINLHLYSVAHQVTFGNNQPY
jgi:hypothetical protein